MSISQEAWQDIWNEGYQHGWNSRYHQSHPIVAAPSNVSLCISADNWNDVWTQGYQAAYGVHVAAPGPTQIPHDDAVCPTTQPIYAPVQPVATVASLSGPQFGYSASQWGDLYLVWRIGHDLGAPYLAIQAALCAVMGEGSLGGYVCNSGGYCGLWQVGHSWQAQHDWHDNAYWTTWAYQHGFYGYGGIISIARNHPSYSAGYIANMCQGAYSDLTAGGDYYGKNAGQANQVYNYFQGSGATTPPPTVAPTVQPPLPSDAKQVFESYNWAGDYELEWQRVYGGIKQAHTESMTYYARLVTSNYVKPNTFG